MKYRFTRLFFIFSLFVFSAPSLAATVEKSDDIPAPGDEVFEQGLRERLTVIIWGDATGGRVSALSSDNTPNADGSSGSPQGLSTAYVAAHYALSPFIAVGPTVYFNLYPGQKNPAVLGDSALSIQSNNWYNQAGWNVSSEILTFFPTSESSKNASMAAGIRAITNVFYTLPKSRFGFGIYGYLHGAEYSNTRAAVATNSDALYGYVAPYANYKLSRDLAASLWVDLVQLHKKVSVSNLANDPVDLKPGMSWDVSKNINLNPYLGVYPGRPELSNTFVGMFVSTKLL